MEIKPQESYASGWVKYGGYKKFTNLVEIMWLLNECTWEYLKKRSKINFSKLARPIVKDFNWFEYEDN